MEETFFVIKYNLFTYTGISYPEFIRWSNAHPCSGSLSVLSFNHHFMSLN